MIMVRAGQMERAAKIYPAVCAARVLFLAICTRKLCLRVSHVGCEDDICRFVIIANFDFSGAFTPELDCAHGYQLLYDFRALPESC